MGNARFYDPTLGRFTQPDTIVPGAGNPQAFDRYAYGLNNPSRYTDPSGHTPCEGDNWDDGPRCLQDPNSTLSIVVANTRYQNTEGEEFGEEAGEYIEIGASVLVEPIDWAATVYHCVNGDCSPWVLVGLLPFIPSSAGRYADDIGNGLIKATGQWHHVFSTKIMRALNRHETLSGLFKRNGLLTQAKDHASHRGYQTWHRLYDKDVVRWLETIGTGATPRQFLEYLKDVYNSPDMVDRFPDAVNLITNMIEALP